MSSRLTKSDVAYVAALAHLELTPTEVELFTRQLADILAYAEQLGAVDTSDVPPTSRVLTDHTADRPDVVRPSLTRAEALDNAPDPAVEAGLFRVPRVIG